MQYIKSTDCGSYREENQDRAEVFENEIALLAVLCDGMGGHFGGSLAASITIETFRKQFSLLSANVNQVYDWFKQTIKMAKLNMLTEAGDNDLKRDMGTTVTAAVIFKAKNDIIVFNIGDSRTYLFNGELRQITVDHNLMNYYIMKDKISEFEASQMPGAHALTSALGPSKKTNIEAFNIDVSPQPEPRKWWFKKNAADTQTINQLKKMYLILTSDGIHDYITKPHFESIVSNEKVSLEGKAKDLIQSALRGGSLDNLTCIIVEVA